MIDNPSSHDTLKNHINDKTVQVRLTETQLQDLLQLQSESSNTEPSKPKAGFLQAPLTYVAASLAVFFLGILTAQQLALDIDSTNTQPHLVSHESLLQSIATEVVDNHLKLKPLDIETQAIDKARQFLDQLDFSPIQSITAATSLGLGDYLLIGGRYCSIQGTSAAQLRYRRDGQLRTLYQVPYHLERYGPMPTAIDQPPLSLSRKGLNVTLWVERDLLMVLVSP
ncbi:MAG: hypothetical protein ACRBBW_07350 [Cellvibrionaceae bacterium]